MTTGVPARDDGPRRRSKTCSPILMEGQKPATRDPCNDPLISDGHGWECKWKQHYEPSLSVSWPRMLQVNRVTAASSRSRADRMRT
jgi:hypothetical protein